MAENIFDLTNRVIIVAGGGHAIGRVYCEHLAKSGAKVVIAEIDGPAGVETAEAIANDGGTALAIETDVTDEAAVKNMVAETIGAYGQIDGIINNAAYLQKLTRKPFFEIDVDEWDKVMAVNLRGLFLCCREVYPQMKSQGRGRIVNISSGRALYGGPDRLHYTTSKLGVVGFTRALAREVGPVGITVNTVAPGFTMSQTQIELSDPAYIKAKESENRAIPRLEVPEDLIGAVSFLLSDAAAYITGQLLNVDGGHTMH